MDKHYIVPSWPAPDHVKAVVTTRRNGASQGGYRHFNLATHVADSAAAVAANRQQLRTELGLSTEPQWLEQVHGVKVVTAQNDGRVRTADAVVSAEQGLACAVLTADCLPIFLCDEKGTQVAAIHAGWRSLAAGIVPRTVARLTAPAEQLIAWLGPAISAQHFEVGVDVLEAFFDTAGSVAHSDAIAAAIRPGTRPMHFYADLFQLARAALAECGVGSVHGGDMCTYATAEQFYSYRRDGHISGRMASLIWLQST